MNLIRRVFPTRPAMGMTLVGLLLLEGIALAIPVLKQANAKAVEGDWTRDPAKTPISTGFRCTYQRTDDGCSGAFWYWDDAWNYDCYSKPPSEGGHHKSAHKDITVSQSCPAKEMSDAEAAAALTMDGSPSIPHTYNVHH